MIAQYWTRTGKFDRACALLADGHYSRRTPGSPQFMPPGETVILRTPGDGEPTAIFGWWRPHPDSGIKAMNGLDGWTCTIFRNVGPVLSSDLILDAEIALYSLGVTCGPSGLITYVFDRKVQTFDQPGRNASGWCFRKAGYRPAGRSADTKKTLLMKPWGH